MKPCDHIKDRLPEIIERVRGGQMVKHVLSRLNIKDSTFRYVIAQSETFLDLYQGARIDGESLRRKKSTSEGLRTKSGNITIRHCALCGKLIPSHSKTAYHYADLTCRKPERLYFCCWTHILEWDRVCAYDSLKSTKRIRQCIELAEETEVNASLASFVLFRRRSECGRLVSWLCGACPEHPLIDRYDNLPSTRFDLSMRIPPLWIGEVIERMETGRSVTRICRQLGESPEDFFYWIQKSKNARTSPWVHKRYTEKKEKGYVFSSSNRSPSSG